MKKNKNLLIDTVLYGGSQIVGKVVTIFTLPVLLNLLEPESYGTIAIYIGFQQILSIYISSGARPSVNKFYGNLTSDNQKIFLKYFLNKIIFKSSALLISVIVFIYFIPNSLNVLDLMLVFIISVLVAIDALLDPVSVVSEKAYENSLLASANAVLAPILAIIFLYFNDSIAFYFLAIVISHILKLSGLIYLNNSVSFSGSKIFNKKEVEIYSKRNNFLSISQKSIRWSDRIFIGLFLGASATGEYHSVVQLVLILEYLSSASITALKPFIFNSQNLNYNTINKILNSLIYTCICLGTAGSFLRFNLGQAIIPRDYWIYLDLVPIIALSIVINTIYKLLSIVADFNSNDINYINHSIIVISVQIILGVLLINVLGVVGMLITYLVTYSINILLIYKEPNTGLNELSFDKVNPILIIFVYIIAEIIIGNFFSFAGGVQARWVSSFLVLIIGINEFYKLKLYTSKIEQ